MSLIRNISQSFPGVLQHDTPCLRLYEMFWINEVQEILNCKSISEDRCKEQVWTTIYNSFTICKRECHIYYFTIKLWILSIHPSNIVVIDRVSKTMQEKNGINFIFLKQLLNLKTSTNLPAWENKSLDNCPRHGLVVFCRLPSPDGNLSPSGDLCYWTQIFISIYHYWTQIFIPIYHY